MASELEGINREATHCIWELIESNNFDSLDEVLAEDVVVRLPGQEVIRGIDGYKEYIRTYKEASRHEFRGARHVR